jgi:hypothetical protein
VQGDQGSSEDRMNVDTAESDWLSSANQLHDAVVQQNLAFVSKIIQEAETQDIRDRLMRQRVRQHLLRFC